MKALVRLVTAGVLGALAAPLGAQARDATADRLLLWPADRAAREVSLLVRREGGARLEFQADGLAVRGDTLTVRVYPGSPAAVFLPAGEFRAELRAVPGGPGLAAELVTAADPTRRRPARADGPVLLVSRDPVLGRLSLGAAAR